VDKNVQMVLLLAAVGGVAYLALRQRAPPVAVTPPTASEAKVVEAGDEIDPYIAFAKKVLKDFGAI
jgi:hypothetical protein